MIATGLTLSWVNKIKSCSYLPLVIPSIARAALNGELRSGNCDHKYQLVWQFHLLPDFSLKFNEVKFSGYTYGMELMSLVHSPTWVNFGNGISDKNTLILIFEMSKYHR